MSGVSLALRREMSGRDDIPDSIKIKMNDVTLYFLEKEEKENEKVS